MLIEIAAAPEAGDSEDPVHQTFAAACARLNMEDLVEVLKRPFCVDEAQKLVLAELERKSGHRFGGDLRAIVTQSPSRGIGDLERPVRRPLAGDIIRDGSLC